MYQAAAVGLFAHKIAQWELLYHKATKAMMVSGAKARAPKALRSIDLAHRPCEIIATAGHTTIPAASGVKKTKLTSSARHARAASP